jgi:hypothetical protein
MLTAIHAGMPCKHSIGCDGALGRVYAGDMSFSDDWQYITEAQNRFAVPVGSGLNGVTD